MKLTIVGETVVDTEEQPNFDAYWLLQVKKVSRYAAEKEWNKLTEGERLDAMVAWVAWRPIQAKKDWEFRVHPSTWLHQKRWTDELPQEYTTAHFSHTPATLPASGERSVMPDNVRQLLAKLRKDKS